MIEALQKDADAKYGKGESVPVGGPTTAGSIINIKGHDIQLPKNVQIDGLISHAIFRLALLACKRQRMHFAITKQGPSSPSALWTVQLVILAYQKTI